MQEELEMESEVEKKLNLFLHRIENYYNYKEPLLNQGETHRMFLICFVNSQGEYVSYYCNFYLNELVKGEEPEQGPEQYRPCDDISFSDNFFTNYSDPGCISQGSLFEGIYNSSNSQFYITDIYFLSGVNLSGFTKEERLKEYIFPIFCEGNSLLEYHSGYPLDYLIKDEAKTAAATGAEVAAHVEAAESAIENTETGEVKEFYIYKSPLNLPEIYNLASLTSRVRTEEREEQDSILALIPSMKCSKLIEEALRTNRDSKSESKLKVKCRYHPEFKKWYPIHIYTHSI